MDLRRNAYHTAESEPFASRVDERGRGTTPSSRNKADGELLDGDNVFLESDGSDAEDVGHVEESAPVDDGDDDLFAGLLSESSDD